MTRTTYNVTGVGEVFVHHNSDWSGDAIVAWYDATRKERREVIVPAGLLVAIGRGAGLTFIRDRLVAMLEDIERG